MKKIIFIALVVVIIKAQAQPVYVDQIGFKLESIADIDIGWIKTYKHITPPKAKTLGNRIYSANQIGYSQQWMEWMQQSYLPKGCLGEAGYFQNTIPKFSSTNSRMGNAINEHLAALPHLYGAYSTMYMFLKKDAQGKFVPQNNFAEYWFVEANQLENITLPIFFISSSDDYFFIFPDFKSHSKGYDAGDKAASNLLGFDNHKNIERFKHFYVPPKTLYDNQIYAVIMTKDNKELPFEKITIGEFFSNAEKQFPAWQKIVPVSAENYALAQKNLARLKDKYKSKWNDIAELKLRDSEITLQYFVNAREDRSDMFDNSDIYGKEGAHTTFPILRVKKTTLDLCKTDQPQWLVIRWTLGMPNAQFNIHLHESVLNNFNFDYVYNYFFDPAKVAGQSYKPLRSPLFKETAAVTELSEASKKNNANKSVFFFEDFSGTAVGKPPVNWNSNLINGEKAIVAETAEAPGKWMVVKGHTINFSNSRKPFPPNFELSFDVAVPKDFTWGAKGLELVLAKEKTEGATEAFVSLKLRPGYGGRDGEVTLETKFPSGYANGTKWYAATGFSNDKIINRIHVAVQKRGETLHVFIDNKAIAEYPKGIPVDLLFNALSFRMGNSNAETEKYYVSNIKMTKE
jgi:hypothetical protein